MPNDHDPIRLLRGTSLQIRIAVLKPGIVLATARGEVVGAADVEIEQALLAALDAELERAGSLQLFVDLRESPRMPAASRARIATWMRRHQARLLPSHALVQSTWIERALATIAMLVGGSLIKIHTRPEIFLQLLRKVLPKLSELPSIPE